MEEQLLLTAAQAGDQAAIETLLRRYTGMLNHIISGYFLRDGERDDLMQEAMIGFVQAIRDFRPDGGKQFKNFAWLCVKRELDTCIKHSNRKKNLILSDALLYRCEDDEGNETGQPFDQLVDNDRQAAVTTPEEHCIEHETIQEVLHLITSVLSRMEQRVLLLRIAGHSYDDITRALEVENKSVDNAIQRIRKKLNRHQLTALLQS